VWVCVRARACVHPWIQPALFTCVSFPETGCGSQISSNNLTQPCCGLQILLAQLTRQPDYMEAAQAFCDFTVNYQKKTPKGLVYIDKFGTLCHAANVAFVCLQVAISLYFNTFLVRLPNIHSKFCVSASDRLKNCELVTPRHNVNLVKCRRFITAMLFHISEAHRNCH